VAAPAPALAEPEARYPLRIQAIRAKGKNPSFYVYIPTPLAAALGDFRRRGGRLGTTFPRRAPPHAAGRATREGGVTKI